MASPQLVAGEGRGASRHKKRKRTENQLEEFRKWRLERKEAKKQKQKEKRTAGRHVQKSDCQESDYQEETAKTDEYIVSVKPKRRERTDQVLVDEEAKVKRAKKAKKGVKDDKAVVEDSAVAVECGPVADPEAFKVVVAGIPLNVDETILRRDFSECGELLHVRLLKNRETGKSRGIAFISFTTESALNAALKYDGDSYGGRTLVVQVAKPHDVKGSRKSGSLAGKESSKVVGEKPPGCTSVILKGLAYSVTDADLMETFSNCGSGPTHIDILCDRETGTSRGIGFIDFENGKAVDAAMKLNGSELKGRRFMMDFVAPREKAKGPGEKPSGCTALLVKGLPYAATDADLQKVFKAAGSTPKNIRLVVDKGTGVSKGMAFVDFETEGDLENAVKLHGTDLKGRRMILDYAMPAKTATGAEEKAEQRIPKVGKKPLGCKSIVVKDFAGPLSESRLMKKFGKCGEGPRNVNIVEGTAFVNFSSEAAVDEAMEFHGTKYKGHLLVLGYVKPKVKK